MTITMNELSQLAHALVEAEQETAAAEELLKGKKAREAHLREVTLPLAMQELDLVKTVLSTGETITIKDDVYASIPAANKLAVFDWLTEHGYGALIKTEVAVEFGKGELENANNLVSMLRDTGLAGVLTRNVHAQSLKAFLREQIAAAKDIPLDLFGARSVTIAEVKAPKKK